MNNICITYMYTFYEQCIYIYIYIYSKGLCFKFYFTQYHLTLNQNLLVRSPFPILYKTYEYIINICYINIYICFNVL